METLSRQSCLLDCMSRGPECFPGVSASVDMWRLSYFRMPKFDFEGLSEDTHMGSSALTRSCWVNHGVCAIQQPQWCGWNLEKAPGNVWVRAWATYPLLPRCQWSRAGGKQIWGAKAGLADALVSPTWLPGCRRWRMGACGPAQLGCMVSDIAAASQLHSMDSGWKLLCSLTMSHPARWLVTSQETSCQQWRGRP